MQIQFDPKNMDMPEATFVLSVVLTAFLKGCCAQGDTKAEVMAGVAELTSGVWDGMCRAAAEAEKGA